MWLEKTAFTLTVDAGYNLTAADPVPAPPGTKRLSRFPARRKHFACHRDEIAQLLDKKNVLIGGDSTLTVSR